MNRKQLDEIPRNAFVLVGDRWRTRILRYCGYATVDRKTLPDLRDRNGDIARDFSRPWTSKNVLEVVEPHPEVDLGEYVDQINEWQKAVQDAALAERTAKDNRVKNLVARLEEEGLEVRSYGNSAVVIQVDSLYEWLGL